MGEEIALFQILRVLFCAAGPGSRKAGKESVSLVCGSAQTTLQDIRNTLLHASVAVRRGPNFKSCIVSRSRKQRDAHRPHHIGCPFLFPAARRV